VAKLRAVAFDKAGSRLAAIAEARRSYAEQRRDVDAALKRHDQFGSAELGAKWDVAATNLFAAIDDLSISLDNEFDAGDSFIVEMMQIKRLVASARRDISEDRQTVAKVLEQGKGLTDGQRQHLAELRGSIERKWTIVEVELRTSEAPVSLKEAAVAAKNIYFADVRPKRDSILADLATGKPASLSAANWIAMSLPAQLALGGVAHTALDLAGAHAEAQSSAARQGVYAASMLMVLFSSIGLLTAFYVIEGVVRPISKITETMRSVAGGNLECAIPFEHRADEIGFLARALRVFRDTAIERQHLRVAREVAEAANRAKSDFLAHMSHELRTPLNAIIGFSEIIKTEMFGPIQNPHYCNYGSNIFDSGKHLLGLINEILDMSKLDSGQLELFEEEIDLAVVVKACLELVEPQAERAKVRLAHTLDGELPLLRADDRRLRQILINLISNAVKFTPDDGRVLVSSFRGEAGMVIEVNDTGIGMAPEDIPKSFDPFVQIESTFNRKYEGTGLGLPLAKRLVELHGGTLTIERKLNAGTTVRVVFPSDRIVVSGARAPKSNEAIASQTESQLKIA
jgi:signal transduction histidine kinase